MTPDGTHLFVPSADGADVFAFNVASSGALSAVLGSPFGAGNTPVGGAVTPNGRFFYTVNQDQKPFPATASRRAGL